jgi:hypothetical protein
LTENHAMSESKTAREVHVKSDRQSSTAIECGGEKKVIRNNIILQQGTIRIQ